MYFKINIGVINLTDLQPQTCLPQLNTKAPDFTADTTFGPMNLSDFNGQWVVLFSHPGDFTPVCTTEFIAFARCYPQFRAKNVQLLGLSVDGQYSHLAWVHNIYRMTGIQIPFPIIDDSSREVSKLYGMISDASSPTQTVRAVFIIDPKQELRAVLYYPLTTGRWIPEILRIIDALQATDQHGTPTPANWLPGKPVVLPPPKTYQELLQRINDGCSGKYNCIDWYLCFKGI